MQPLTAPRREPPVRREPPMRRDPAPSRAAYRMHRLWLTPMFRTVLRVWLPIIVIGAGLGVYFSDRSHRELIADNVAAMWRSVEERPEFMVKLMAIDGASTEVSDDIREIVSLDFPLSSFDLNLPETRELIEQIDAVSKADLRVRPGGILQVSVTERLPAVVWRADGALELLDSEGHRVASMAQRVDRPDLPLLAGVGAEQAVPEALALFAAGSPIRDRIRGLVRVGERRWDIVLDRGQRIMLPEHRPVPALEEVIALDQAQELLARDVTAIDMRNIHRPTLLLASPAIEELRRIRAFAVGAQKE